MKQTRLFLLTLMSLLMISVSISADDQPIPVNQLPASVTTFAKKHFPKQTIQSAEKDAEFGGTEYEIYLSSGTKVKFNKRGNWDKVDCGASAVPATIVPAAISKYVKANYPGQKITKIERDGNKYEVELSNRTELKFDSKGRFLKVDR